MGVPTLLPQRTVTSYTRVSRFVQESASITYKLTTRPGSKAVFRCLPCGLWVECASTTAATLSSSDICMFRIVRNLGRPRWGWRFLEPPVWSPQYSLTLGTSFAVALARAGIAAWNVEYRRVGAGGGDRSSECRSRER